MVTRRICCDVREEMDVATAVAAISHKLDAFVNTIGTFSKQSVSKIDIASVQRHFELNVIGNMRLNHAVLPGLRQPFAQFLQCGSTLALGPRSGCGYCKTALQLHCCTATALLLSLHP